VRGKLLAESRRRLKDNSDTALNKYAVRKEQAQILFRIISKDRCLHL
jgi:hypothetical protein